MRSLLSQQGSYCMNDVYEKHLNQYSNMRECPINCDFHMVVYCIKPINHLYYFASRRAHNLQHKLKSYWRLRDKKGFTRGWLCKKQARFNNNNNEQCMVAVFLCLFDCKQ